MNKKIKTLIIYKTGIHYIIIINEKGSLLMNKNYIQFCLHPKSYPNCGTRKGLCSNRGYDKTFFVTTYNLALPNFAHIIHRHSNVLYSSDRCRNVFFLSVQQQELHHLSLY